MQRLSAPEGCSPIGYAGLIAHYVLDCPLPRRAMALAESGARRVIQSDRTEWLLLAKASAVRLPATPMGHIGFALKHEGVDLRVLSRIFAQDIEDELTAFVRAKPSGIYARKAWFLFEWLTGRTLDVEPQEAVAYVPVLDPVVYFTRTPVRSIRHKVLDNLPGVRGFCPLVRRTEHLASVRLASLRSDASSIVGTADPAVLRRAVAYMLLNESKGSFNIEGESPPRTRLERWGSIIAGARNVELSVPKLERLQRSLFDTRLFGAGYGLRREGGFVGRHDRDTGTPLPDHISARPEDVEPLLRALLSCFDLLVSDGFDPILTAALIGFGFVFIHPFEDGNGRLHRFLFQKALMDGGFNPDGVVLPLSAAILDDLAGYRATLEDFSFAALDGIAWEPTSRGNVEVVNDTAYLYGYFDATRQAEFLAACMERTIHFALPNELRYLAQFDDAKRRIAEVADMPDRLASLLIQFCVQNGGRLAARKRAEYFADVPPEVLVQLEEAIRDTGITEPPPHG